MNISKKILVSCIALALIGGALFFLFRRITDQRPYGTVKVGILHSLTGTMAISEKAVVDATLMAIEEINQRGGVLNKTIEPIVIDGKSDWPTFAQQAEKLITEHKVAVIFGCWTSASRKLVKPVVEKHDHLLFYPVQYEGLEQSPNIIYTGAAPNQQIIPGVKWSFDHLGKRFFLVGSDYVFPRTANEIIKEQVASLNGQIVGEEYVVLGGKDVQHIVDKIVATKPDVILNTINGDTNVHFFKALRKAGITPEKAPTMSFSIAEPELAQLGTSEMVGDYATWNYFQSVKRSSNETFVENFKKKYGEKRIVSDPLEAAYFGVHLWAKTAREIGTADTKQVKKSLNNQAYNAPGAVVHIDSANHHTWKNVLVGKIRHDGQFTIIWESKKAVRPVPYPIYRTHKAWEQFLNSLYESWGKQWAKSTNS